MSQLIGLFPTPVMRVPGLLEADAVAALAAEAVDTTSLTNAYSDLLSHTPVAGAEANSLHGRLGALVLPKVAEFGEVLFGEALTWQIKETWVNVLEPGGHQAIHTHANSFISGVVYLTEAHPSANIVFHKSIGGTGFLFGNSNPNARVNAFNGGKWAMPETRAGDLVMFPSYLLHEVPANRGGRRISIAFNAIPDRLDNFGYAIRFA
ncbi:2OG-Fe(II) oxygenase family protein [Xanthobacter autotrophicus]|uniref:TIGR02466 family protein n=1 Tax=Xanthobacter TaxID=279 RepID=UPI0024AC70EC|nr:TIGR02466 family protein [Xanthobacter autotrophicus]MDI4665579.1 2OG-Fe(II) oxygenase family protein [Xanthobacter autotrophicus]